MKHTLSARKRYHALWLLALCAFVLLAARPAYAADSGHYTSNKGNGNFSSIAQLQKFLNNGKSFTAMDIYMDSNWSGVPLELPGNSNIVLHMQGHVYDRGLTKQNSSGHVIKVNSKTSLTINGGARSNKQVRTWNSSGEQKSATISACGVITGGYSTNKSGGIDLDGNTKLTLNDVTIVGCRAEQNWGKDGYGGGIWAEGSNTTVALNNSEISHCYAYNDGGGIYAGSDKFFLFMKNAKIKENYAKRNGGGIMTNSTDTVVSGNAKTEVSNNANGGKIGGGVYVNGAGTSVSGFLVEGNRTAGGGGGVGTTDTNITLSGLTIRRNTAAQAGGGVYIGDFTNGNARAMDSIADCTIVSNNVTQTQRKEMAGGGVYVRSTSRGPVKAFTLFVNGKCVIKDNGNQGNLITENPSTYMTFNLGRGSEVRAGYAYPKSDSHQVTSPQDKAPNCLRYLTSDNGGYHFTYNDSGSIRKTFLVRDGKTPEGTGSSGQSTKQVTTIAAENATPAEDGKIDGIKRLRCYVRFPNVEKSDADSAAQFYYSDGYFINSDGNGRDPMTYNDALSTTSLCMAMSGFYLNTGKTTDKDGYINKHASARQFMADIGCDDQKIYVNDFNVQKPGIGTIGVTIASKELVKADNTGSGQVLVPIAVRGANYEAEWGSNFTLGDGTSSTTATEAQGFAEAANQVTSEVDAYLARNGLLEKAKQGKVSFWIAGFSRAGATSNLTAKRLIEKYGVASSQQWQCPVFAYTFEAPQGGTDEAENSSNKASYYSIHNIINYGDLVPLVGPTEMGFKRYGVDHYVPGKNHNTNVKSSTQTVTRALNGVSRSVTTYRDNDPEYSYQYSKANMIKQLESVDPAIVYDNYFSTAAMHFWPDMGPKEDSVAKYEKKMKKLISEEVFLRDLLANAQRWCIANRGAYAASVQPAFRSIVAMVFAMPPERAEGFLQRAGTIMNRLPTIGGELSKLEVMNKLIKGWSGLDTNKKKSYVNTFFKQLKATGAYDYLTADEIKLLDKYGYQLMDFIFTFTSKDNATKSYETNTLMMMGTMAHNMSRIMSNHYPELALAWLRSKDNTYSGMPGPYVIANAKSVAAPKAKAGKDASITLETGKENRLNGKQRIVLDVENVKGEAIYYKLTRKNGATSQNKTKDICKNGYDIYRGGIDIDLADRDVYTVTTYAISYGTKSPEVSYVIDGHDDTHKVTVIDNTSGTKQELRLREGATYTVSAVVPANRVFTGWKFTNAAGKDITSRIRLKNDNGQGTNNKTITFTMPAGNDIHEGYGIPYNYALTVAAQFVPRVEELELYAFGIPEASDNDKQLPTLTTLKYVYNNRNYYVDTGISWTRENKTEELANVLYENTTYTAKIVVPKEHASLLSRENGKPTITLQGKDSDKVKIVEDWTSDKDAIQVRKTWNSDGTLTVEVRFTTGKAVGPSAPLDPVTYDVQVAAYDVNNSDADALQGVTAETFTCEYEPDEEDGTTFAVARPNVAGGEFVGWEPGEGIAPVEGKANTFRLTAAPEEDSTTTLSLKAMFKPIVSSITVSELAVPTTGSPLANTAKVNVTLANADAGFATPDIAGGSIGNTLTWIPASADGNAEANTQYTAKIALAPKIGDDSWQFAYDTNTTVNSPVGYTFCDPAQNAAFVSFADATDPQTHIVSVYDGPGSTAQTFGWRAGSTKSVMAKDDLDKRFTGWQVTNGQSEDVTQTVLGSSYTNRYVEFNVPDYDATFKAQYVDRVGAVTAEVAKPAEGAPLPETGKLTWSNGGEQFAIPEIAWRRVVGEQADAVTNLQRTITYTGTMVLPQDKAQQFKSSVTVTKPQDADSATWRRNADGTATVTVVFTNTVTEPKKFSVTVQAFDVNANKVLKNKDNADITQSYTIELDADMKFVLPAPTVEGGVFVDWVVPEGLTKVDTQPAGTDTDTDDYEVDGSSAEFKLNTAPAFDTTPTFTVQARYMPIVKAITVQMAAPVAGQPLATASQITPTSTLANNAFEAIPLAIDNDDGNGLTWDPAVPTDGKAAFSEAYTAAVKVKPAEDKQFAFADDVDAAYNDGSTLGGQSVETQSEPAEEQGQDSQEGDTGAMTPQDAGDEDMGDDDVYTALVADDIFGESKKCTVYLYFPQTATKLVFVCDPVDVYDVPFGTDLASVLPKSTEIIFSDGSVEDANITWGEHDLVVQDVDDDGNVTSTYRVPGTVDLSHAANPDNLSNQVDVYVHYNPEEKEIVQATEPYATVDEGTYLSPQTIFLDTDEEFGQINYRINSDGEFTVYNGEPIYLDTDNNKIGNDGMLFIEAYTSAAGKENSDTVAYVYWLENLADVPEGDELVFDGGPQAGVWGGDNYTLHDLQALEGGPLAADDGIDEEGDACATNVGKYQVTAKVADNASWYVETQAQDSEEQDEEHPTNVPDRAIPYEYDANDFEEDNSDDITTDKNDRVVTFTIVPGSVKSCDVELPASVAYTGSAVTPKPKVTLNGYDMVEGRDYTLSYEDNVGVGKAKVIITGKGNLKDSVTYEFQVDGGNSLPTSYSGHMQTKGDLPAVANGTTLGSVGQAKRLEAFAATVTGGTIEYRAHLQGIGWQDKWTSDGALCGTTGEARRLEAVQIKLSQRLSDAGYHVWYRVHSQTYGWMGWACDGAPAGTAGLAKRGEALQMVVLKGDARPTDYNPSITAFRSVLQGNAHVRRDGWLGYKPAGTIGTTGQAKRMEAFWLKTPALPSAGVEYLSHLRGIGWEASWSANGAISGTTGQSRRMEAVRVKLTGDDAAYLSVWYRVHSQTFGWSGWAKDGEPAGSSGFGKRAEAVELVVLSKGAAAPGPTANAFRTK